MFHRFAPRSVVLFAACVMATLSAHAQLTVTSSVDPVGNLAVNNGSNSSQLFTFTSGQIGAGGLIDDVNISLTFSKNRSGAFGVNPAWFNEIGFALTYGSTTVNLIVGDSRLFGNQATFAVGALRPSFTGTITLDDEAGNSFGLFPASGTFTPAESLSAFDGLYLAPGEAWTLRIYDTSSAGAAVLFDRASLTVQFTPVPEPSTYGLAAAALALGAVIWRRQRRVTAR